MISHCEIMDANMDQNYLNDRSFPDKDVLTFHIPVNNTIGMQVIQCFNLK